MSIKKIIVYLVAVLILIGCFVAYAILTKNQRYKDVVFEITYPSDSLFSPMDLNSFVKENAPEIIGKRIDSVDLADFWEKVKDYPYLESVNIVTNQGVVTIKAKQEKVIAKIVSVDNKWHYLAKSGKIMPESPLPAGRVVIANGHIPLQYKLAELEEKVDSLKKLKGNFPSTYTVWKIANFLDENEFWNAQIGQIGVNEKEDITLVPTVGDHLIVFGKIQYNENASEEIKQRFDNLKNVYKKGFKITGWDKHKTINLKFGYRVPCEKRVE